MPSGRVHLAFELGTLPVWVLGGAWFGVDWGELVVFTSSYVGASLLFSPDLDLRWSDAVGRWGPARFIWYPYTRIFKHRGLSHSILFGPLTRLLYLGVLAAALWTVLHLSLGMRLGWRLPPGRSVAAFLAGIYLDNFLHVSLDRLMGALRGIGRAVGR